MFALKITWNSCITLYYSLRVSAIKYRFFRLCHENWIEEHEILSCDEMRALGLR